jgi:hypothetical protein
LWAFSQKVRDAGLAPSIPTECEDRYFQTRNVA